MVTGMRLKEQKREAEAGEEKLYPPPPKKKGREKELDRRE